MSSTSRISVHWGQWACKWKDEHSLLLYNNWVCWWRKTGQNAWKWSTLLREKNPLPALKIQWTVANKPVSGFTGINSPQGFSKSVSAHPRDHLKSVNCSVLMYSQKVHPTWKSFWCNLQQLSQQHCPFHPWGKKCLSERAWTPVKTLLQECDGGLRYGAAHSALSHPWSTDPGAVPARGNQLAKHNAEWKWAVGMWMIAGGAGENKLSFELTMATSIPMASFLHALATLPSAGTTPTASICKHHTASPTKLLNSLTSSTLHTAPFPSAVRPDVQGILLFFWLASVFSCVVYRNGVFIMNSIILVMK